MKQISISEIQRNLHTLDSFDILEVIDKKRNLVKGYFIDKKYVGLLQKLVENVEKEDKDRQSVAGSLQQYANTSLIKEEENAWKEHIEEKHQI